MFDVDAIGLTNMVARLNHGLDIGGQPFGAPTRFHMGVAVNPFAPDADVEWRRLMHKVEAGAEFLVTPPIFDIAAFAGVLDRLKATGLPDRGGAGGPGWAAACRVPGERSGGRHGPGRNLRAAARRAKDESAEAMALTLEIGGWLRTRVSGVLVTSLHGTPSTAERLLARAGSRAPRRSP